MKEVFDDMIKTLLKEGVEITMKLDKESDTIWYDLNTGMKSGFEIALVNNVIKGKGRYDYETEMSDFSDLIYEVKRCMHGRDFANYVWFDVMKKYS